MKATGRVVLRCSKQIVGRVYDRFEVVVKADKKEAAKKEYERQGYKVLAF